MILLAGAMVGNESLCASSRLCESRLTGVDYEDELGKMPIKAVVRCQASKLKQNSEQF